MSLNTYLGIGAFVVLVLIIVAVTRKKKKHSHSNEPALEVVAPAPLAEPDTIPPTAPPTWNQGGFEISENTEPSTPQPSSATALEVWNQTDFQVFVTQQGIRVSLPPQGRTQMDSRFALTVTPASADDPLHSVSLQAAGAGLIVQ